MHEDLWAGVELKLQHAAFFLEQMGKALLPALPLNASRPLNIHNSPPTFSGWRYLVYMRVEMRKVLTFIALLELAPIILSAQQLSLPVQFAGAGSSLLAPVAFTPGADAVSGLQFDVQYDNSAMTLVATAGDGVRSSQKEVYYNDLAPNTRRFIVVGPNQNPIPGGALLNLFIDLNQNAPSGLYALTFSNIWSTAPSGQPASATGTNGSVTVGGTTGSRLEPAGVMSGGSLTSGPVAPGEIVTLIGAGIGPAVAAQPASSPTSVLLGGTSVLFDGNPAPLLYAGPNQINAIIPYGVSGQDVTQMLVMGSGQLIVGFPLPVAPSAPGIFTVDASGVGPGAILNQDSTVNSPSNPANRGSAVALFATGAGQTDPPGVDGQVAGGPYRTPACLCRFRWEISTLQFCMQEQRRDWSPAFFR